jgi:hypothetical protein
MNNCTCNPTPFATLNQHWGWKRGEVGRPLILTDEHGDRYGVREVWAECPNCRGEVRREDEKKYHNLPG